MEWVQNISGRPIPEPYAFTADERLQLRGLQRRKQLIEYDDKYKLYPLEPHERAILADFEERILQGQLIRFGGVELPFAPGQIYQVPDGYAAKIVALNPARLRKLEWKDVRDLRHPPAEVHIQSTQEAKELALMVSGGDDTALSHGPVAIEMKDGLMRYGDGLWQGIPAGVKVPEA